MLGRRPSATGTPVPGDKTLKSRWSDDQSLRKSASDNKAASNNASSSKELPKPPASGAHKKALSHKPTTLSVRSAATARSYRTVSADHAHKPPAPIYQQPILDVSVQNTIDNAEQDDGGALADELDYIAVSPPSPTASASAPSDQLVVPFRPDKASRILGIKHRRSMEPIPASNRTSLVSTRSARDPPPVASFTPTLPLTSLYVVSGLPKAPHTWTLADPDSIMGLAHSEGAVSRWWRAEVLGSTVSPGAGGGKKKKKGKNERDEVLKGAGALSKQEVGKMLSKALKLSFTREVEIIASTLQPASTVHTFSFTLPAPSTPLAPSASSGLLRSSVLSAATASDIHRPNSTAGSLYPYHDPFSAGRPSSAFLGPPGLFPPGSAGTANVPTGASSGGPADEPSSNVTYHGVCLTVWSHADAERSAAIRRTLEASRSRKESAQSLVAARLRGLRADATGVDPTLQARRSTKRSARGPWGGPGGAVTDGETDMEAETDGAMSESDFDAASTVGGHNPGESTLFLPGDTVFWLPYALTLVSRHPIYDLMRDYLTLSWARFSKDVQSHTLQISKILSHPAPRAGDLIKLDASATVKPDAGAGPSSSAPDTSLEVIARFPGGLDFGRGLVDINFTMWPLFKALNIDNILTICEIAMAPTGRILFFSRHPAMLGIAVSTIKYLVELRGWNGIALQAVHSRDAKIYIDDPGPWIIGLATEARYAVRPPGEVCICDLDINYLSCPSPPPGVVSTKQQRERYRQRLLTAFEPHYHPDHSVPSEFKEAFPAGRFRPVCKIQAKRGASSAAVADTIKPPEWWHSTRIIQAFDAVLQDRFKKPSLLKRISSLGSVRRAPQLTIAEQHIQHSIRKRATAFVDARDDLETKIGRLSRRLNFLMTESDLWRDKFVTFETYAEKLSIEANELRAKINKEQRETKRLSGLVTSVATEKTKLQSQLRDTEYAHKEALVELQNMRETMETMEAERSAMVAEVEAQIEKALASMAVGMDDSDEYDSRPASRVSSRSRGTSDAATRLKQLRSYGTESTLADSFDGHGQDEATAKMDLAKDAVIEEEEDDEKPLSPSKKKRFSATQMETQGDGMNAVDEGISERSDRIARKVLAIQKKLENALSADADSGGWKSSSPDSESELSDMRQSATSRPHPPKGTKLVGKPPAARVRSGTASSTGSHRPDTAETTRGSRKNSASTEQTPKMPTAAQFAHDVVSPRTSTSGATTPTAPGEIPDEHLSEKEKMPHNPQALRKIPSSVSLSATRPASPSAQTPTTPALTPAMTGTTDDSDTDFQSAYSMSPSPRESYGSFNDRRSGSDGSSDLEEFSKRVVGHFADGSAPRAFIKNRERVGSIATTVGSDAQPSPTLSEDTVVSQARAAKRAATSGVQ